MRTLCFFLYMYVVVTEIPSRKYPGTLDNSGPASDNILRVRLSTLMASNTPDQSTPPLAYSLGPPCSLGSGAPSFIPGEYVLVRIPEEIQVGGHVDNEATAVGTDLPPTSNGSSPQHFAFIRLMDTLPGNACVLEVYPVLSFSRIGGAVSTYNKLPDTAKAALLPLPPLSFRHPTPDSFGAPLDLGDWSNSRDSFLHVIPRRFVMPPHRPVSLFA